MKMSPPTSILAIDCGTATTIVMLIAPLNGNYRLIARGEALTTSGHPWHDITVGVVDAIRIIEEKTGLNFLDAQGTPITPRTETGRGVDAMVVVASAAQPLQLTLAGLMPGISLASAKQAIATTYGTLNQELDLSQIHGQPLEEQVTALQKTSADVILLVGGVDGGSSKPVLDLAHIISLALQLTPASSRPSLIFAGNSHLRSNIADILGGLTTLKPVDNVQPSLNEANPGPLQNELDNLYLERRMAQLPGFDTLSQWASGAVMPTSKSYTQTIKYLGQSFKVNVLGADVGSAHTTLAIKREEAEQGFTISNLGNGYGLQNLLNNISLDNIKRWLPFEIEPDELETLLLNRSLTPHTVPHNYRDVLLEVAITREVLRFISTQARRGWPKEQDRQRWFNWDLLIGSGGALTQLPNPALAALALLDGLEPVGISSLALDTGSMMAVSGAVAATYPLAAVQVTGYDALINLGVMVAPVGVALPGDKALKLKITYLDTPEAGQTESETLQIPFGQLEVLPLKPGQKAELDIRPSRNFDLSPSGETPGKGLTATVEGGLLGLIIDTRGRPLILATTETDRHKQLREWLLNLGLDVSQTLDINQNTSLAGLLNG